MYWYEVGCDLDVRMAGDVPSSITFGAVHEAIMVGWSSGMVSVYDASALGSAWSSFKAHPSPVRQLTSLGLAGTLSVSATHVCMHSLAGAPYVSAQLLHSTREGRELTSVLALDSSRFVVGCNAANNGSSLYELDLSRIESQYLHKFRSAVYDHGVDIMRPTPHGAIVCGGGTGDSSGDETRGKVGLVDLRAGTKTGNLLSAHSGGITDMDIYETKLLTCGLGPNGMTDRFVKMFDIRMLARPAGALQVSSRFVRFLPPSEEVPVPGRALFLGEMGNLCAYADLHEAVASAHMEQSDQLHSLQGIATGMCVSPVGRAAAICDAAGGVHLWTDDEVWAHEARPNINVFQEPLEDTPPPSFAASDKRMDNLQFWEEANFDLVAQSMLSSCDVSDLVAAGHELCSDLSPFFTEKCPIEKNPREIHPDILDRAQTREGFPGQFIETTSDEFPVPQSLVFGKTTSKRAYLQLHEEHAGPDMEGGTPPTSPSRGGRGRGGGQANSARRGLFSIGKDSSARTNKGTPDTGRRRRGGASAGGEELLESDPAAEVPENFVKPRIILSRVGPTQVDYAAFNLTPFAGLEGKLPNTYANPIIQVFYFTPELRSLVLPYVSADPKCLATEAGFLFHMLDQAQQVPARDRVCEARNFLRAFRLAPDVQAFGLLEPSPLAVDQRAAACARFLLEQFSRSHQALKDAVRQTFGVRVVTREKWLVQGIEDSQLNSHSLALDIAYPSELSKAAAMGRELPEMSFLSLLRKTFNQSNKTRLWSKQKGDQIPVVQSRTATAFSDILILNAASHENRAVYLPLFRQKGTKGKGKGGYVKTAFRVKPAGSQGNSGETTVVETIDAAALAGAATKGGGFIYELVAVVSHIAPVDHVIAHIKMPASYAKRAGSPKDADQWMLFNDFCVERVTDVSSVVDFTHPSRNPCLFVYRRRGSGTSKSTPANRIEPSLTDKEVFHAPSVSTAPASRSFVQLELDKLPREGDLVAIDCEMVALSTEEFYTNSEGRKVVTQEPQLSLARVSCTCEDEKVFIDDYIRTPDEVVDYLTRFSGLVPGDLDPALSKHHLVPLRIAYLKLRRLVDRGCIFVGHGLRQDFHIINIFVPPEQVRDTVHLFRIPDNRMLSLSFLSSVVLQQEIQGKTHDSIEDALMALRLFKVYNKEKAAGTLQETLTTIYDTGRKRNFR
ncbi:PAB-dependent polyA-specific ribonuclease subunit PAN2 [Hondaea fermentalgiana]|uniref:PAB-dependent polyA-specific ribonuclease subunit PAN2 n=1 Tax=Hondaea fermentalgiana TaxID=2315210 RepID=A0A2R5GN01_9STRA|nr:PAB-dependent polyA-specific ribonuclease subunit PAN2 [Hondaea fermentalgiana]|eukprot:GBG32270.1 PAB-dependent polyA-specific ribonuclease subunit PAN2 [Hondaea fermentalgiana]